MPVEVVAVHNIVVAGYAVDADRTLDSALAAVGTPPTARGAPYNASTNDPAHLSLVRQSHALLASRRSDRARVNPSRDHKVAGEQSHAPHTPARGSDGARLVRTATVSSG